MPPGCLFYDSQNVALPYNDVFLSIQLYFCSCIFGIDDLLSCLYLHGNFLTVYHSARTYGDYLCLLRLSCALLVRMIPDFVVSSASHCFNTTLSLNGTNFIL